MSLYILYFLTEHNVCIFNIKRHIIVTLSVFHCKYIIPSFYYRLSDTISVLKRYV